MGPTLAGPDSLARLTASQLITRISWLIFSSGRGDRQYARPRVHRDGEHWYKLLVPVWYY